jgi:hypothetical protein
MNLLTPSIEEVHFQHPKAEEQDQPCQLIDRCVENDHVRNQPDITLELLGNLAAGSAWTWTAAPTRCECGDLKLLVAFLVEGQKAWPISGIGRQ